MKRNDLYFCPCSPARFWFGRLSRFFTSNAMALLPLPKCQTDLYFCPCPPTHAFALAMYPALFSSNAVACRPSDCDGTETRSYNCTNAKTRVLAQIFTMTQPPFAHTCTCTRTLLQMFSLKRTHMHLHLSLNFLHIIAVTIHGPTSYFAAYGAIFFFF